MNDSKKSPSGMEVLDQVRSIIKESRRSAFISVNFTMVLSYWRIGKAIVEEEQRGVKRANYGVRLIKTLSDRLTREFGKGFDITNLSK